MIRITGVSAAVAIAAFMAVAGQASAQSGPAPLNFNWFANGAADVSPSEAVTKARIAVQNARTLANGATWVCSPAGFGQPSRCYRG